MFAFDKYSGKLGVPLQFDLDNERITSFIGEKIFERVIRNAPRIYNMMKYDFPLFHTYLENGLMTPFDIESYLKEMDELMELFYKQIKKYKKRLYEYERRKRINRGIL